MAGIGFDSITSGARDALGGVADGAARTAARVREEAEDTWAEAREVAGNESLHVGGRDAAVYAGIAATAAVGVVELPVAAALGAGYALVRRARGG